MVHEKGAVGQAGQAVLVRFAAHLFKTGRLLGEHRLEAIDHRIHRAGQAFQLGRRRFLDCCEAPFADGLRLPDHGVEGAADTAQELHAKEAHQAAADGEPAEQFEGATP